ncbi:hypothetical protein FACS189451_11690 [Bacteroidia bacterium]|nr:hypothetical protein FACS189451_11690 [Bacteroidia bacterium]
MYFFLIFTNGGIKVPAIKKLTQRVRLHNTLFEREYNPWSKIIYRNKIIVHIAEHRKVGDKIFGSIFFALNAIKKK